MIDNNKDRCYPIVNKRKEKRKREMTNKIQ